MSGKLREKFVYTLAPFFLPYTDTEPIIKSGPLFGESLA